ncbi:hypothetical protein P8452_30425 [Trifolium repens]|nr:hypothetical protein QL285_018340 [Trifolium repens]WJX43302.1 hypothetical protein P8452_30425 [Trifolium repens]
MNLDKLREWASDQNTIRKTCNHSSSNVDSSSSSTNHFGNNTPALRKAMIILESQFSHPHVSVLSSIDEVNNNKNMMNVVASDHLDLPGGSSSHSDEPPVQMINVVATDGDEFDEFVQMNVVASDHLDLPGGSSSHSDEPPVQMINVVATDGDEFGDGNNNRKKKLKKSADDGTIRSLSCPKYGPYRCSVELCEMVFATSQKFASHVKVCHHKGGKKQK